MDGRKSMSGYSRGHLKGGKGGRVCSGPSVLSVVAASNKVSPRRCR